MSRPSPARSSASTVAGGGGGSSSVSALDDLYFRHEILSVHDRKDEAMRILKSDLMEKLNKEVKSLEEDNWMFEGPRSRIYLVSRTGSFLHKHVGIAKTDDIAQPK